MARGPPAADDRPVTSRDNAMAIRPLPAGPVARPTSLVTVLVLASLFPVCAVLRGLELSLYFEPTDVALYAAGVGHALVPAAAIATSVLIAVAVGIRWIRPEPSRVLTAGIAVTVSLVLGLTGLAWVAADRAMHPYGPELRAVSAFVPPAGAERRGTKREASENPEVAGYWHVPGSVAAVCTLAVGQFERWADPGTVVNEDPARPTSCRFRALRSGRPAELSVSGPYEHTAGRAFLSLEVRRRGPHA